MKVYKIKVNGKSYKVEVEAIEEVASAPVKEEKKVEEKKVISSNATGQPVPSPIQGTVVSVKVKPGDKVKKGDVLLVIEAMKLENAVPSPFDGEVAEVLVNKGQMVSSKEVVAYIK